MTDTDMGQALRRLREWAGLGQVALAARHEELSKSAISAHELSQRLPSGKFIDAAVTTCLHHRGLSPDTIITELGRWQQARDMLDHQRRKSSTPTTAAAAQPDPAPAPPVSAAFQGQAIADTPLGEQPAGRSRAHRRWRWAAGVVASVAVAVVVWLIGHHPDQGAAHNQSRNDRAMANAIGPAQPLVTSPPYVAGTAYSQTVNSPEGARTYTDPRGMLGEGRRILNHTTVHVSCKIIAPGSSSVGTYWYRIESPPWNNRFYSPTNSFLNDNPIIGRHDKAVDETVPYCPP